MFLPLSPLTPLYRTPLSFVCHVRRAQGPVIVACPDGGTSIEDLAESNPELILKVWSGMHGIYVRMSERWEVGGGLGDGARRRSVFSAEGVLPIG